MPCPVSEARHGTGHKSRLDRDLKNRFGSRDYAAEELAIRRLDQDLRHCYVLAVVFDVKRLSDLLSCMRGGSWVTRLCG